MDQIPETVPSSLAAASRTTETSDDRRPPALVSGGDHRH